MTKRSALQQAQESKQQPARQHNIEAIATYFKSGITESSKRLGIELEHIIVDEKTCQPVSYAEEHGVLWFLQHMAEQYPDKSFDTEGDLLGVARPSEAITLEPAAQVELSAGPFDNLDEARRCFDAFEDELTDVFSTVGKKPILLGYHPSSKASELEIIPKRRYKFMNFYFNEIGPYGACMMRGSASTQISIDYHSVEDCLKKLKVAFALVPLFSLLCDNSPIFEGEPRKHQLVRTKIWQECDPDRCGLVPGVMEPDFSLEAYAEYVLDTPAILNSCNKEEWCYTEKTFGEIYAEECMGRDEVEHALSMLFNDVRLKTYIEIRPADALPIPYVIAYAALIKGLFYTQENLDDLYARAMDICARDIHEAKNALMKDGFKAQVYGEPVAEIADRLIAMAESAIDDTDRSHLKPLSDLVAERMTLADKGACIEE